MLHESEELTHAEWSAHSNMNVACEAAGFEELACLPQTFDMRVKAWDMPDSTAGQVPHNTVRALPTSH